MKRVLLICWIACISAVVSAQDFASRFMAVHNQDVSLNCISISPKMMQEIMKADIEKDDRILDIISNLKSMQMLTSEVKGKKLYKDALDILERNSNRFEPFLSLEDDGENYRIMVRKKEKKIIELVMLTNEKNNFVVVNFTGKMDDDFINKLADSMKMKEPLNN